MLYTGGIDNTDYDTVLNSIKSVMIDQLGFTLISDSGTGSSRAITFGLIGHYHYCNFSYNGTNNVLYCYIMSKDNTISLIDGYACPGNPTNCTSYKAVSFNNTRTLYLYSSSNYLGWRCPFLYCTSGVNKHVVGANNAYSPVRHSNIITDDNDNKIINSTGVKFTCNQTTISGKDIISPIIFPSLGDYTPLCNTPVDDIKVCYSIGGSIGAVYTAGGKKYILDTLPNAAHVRLLVRYE